MLADVSRKPLGQWLLDERVLDRTALQRALERQRKEGGRLGDQLLRGGDVSPRDLVRCLALQHDLLWVNLALSPPSADALHKVSANTARALKSVPVKVLSGTLSNMLLVAFGEPPTESTLAWLRAETGMQVEPALADPEELSHALQFYEALHLPMLAHEDDGGPGTLPPLEPLAGDEPASRDIAALVDRDLGLASWDDGPGVAAPSDAHAVVMPPFTRVEAQAGTDPDGPALAARDAPAPASTDELRALLARVEKLESQVCALTSRAADADRLRTRVTALEAQLLAMEASLLIQPLPEEPTGLGVPAVPPITDDEADALFDGVRVAPPAPAPAAPVQASRPPPLPAPRADVPCTPPPAVTAASPTPAEPMPFASLLAEAGKRPR